MGVLGNALVKVAEKWGQSASKFLPDLCTIKRMAAASGTASLSTIHSTVPCKPTAGGGGGGGDAIRAKAGYSILMPANLSGVPNGVKVEDLIVVAARGIQPARTYKVQVVDQAQGIKVIARCSIES